MAAPDSRSPHSNHDDDDGSTPRPDVNPKPKDKDSDLPPWWWMDPPPFDHKAHHPIPPGIGSGGGALPPGSSSGADGASGTLTAPPYIPTSDANTSYSDGMSMTGSNYTDSSNSTKTSNGTMSWTTGTELGASVPASTISTTPSSTSSPVSPAFTPVNTGITSAIAICTILLFVIAVLLFMRGYAIRRRRRMTSTTQAWASRRLWFSADNAARESHGPSSTTGWDFGTETSLSMRQSLNDFATISGRSATASTSSSSGVPSSWGAFGLSRPQSALSSWTRNSSRVSTSDTSSR